MEAFVYCWTDHLSKKLYIGSHKGTENDGYICSSKIMLVEYNKRPNDFTRQIIAYGNVENIRELEHQILLASNAANSNTFYNISHGGGRFYRKGVTMTEEHKNKISIANKGKLKSKKHKISLKKAKEKLSKETRLKVAYNAGKISGARWNSDENLKKMQSERMKLWWSNRKEKTNGGQ
jgi:hypothetical protein